MIEIGPDNEIILSEKYYYEGTPVYLLSHTVWKENKDIEFKLLILFNLVRVRSKKVKDSLYEQSGHKPVWFHKWFLDIKVAEALGE